MSEIDPRAIVSPSARLGTGVRIGPFAVVGDEVELGDGCVLEPHAVVKGPSTFGRNNHFTPSPSWEAIRRTSPTPASA